MSDLWVLGAKVRRGDSRKLLVLCKDGDLMIPPSGCLYVSDVHYYATKEEAEQRKIELVVAEEPNAMRLEAVSEKEVQSAGEGYCSTLGDLREAGWHFLDEPEPKYEGESDGPSGPSCRKCGGVMLRSSMACNDCGYDVS